MSVNELILSIFQIYSSHLPADWKELHIFYKFNEEASQSFVNYVGSDNVIAKPQGWLNSSDYIELNDIFGKLAPQLSLGQGKVTHVELKLKADGGFETQLGYGAVDWDYLWPDNLTASEYTYNKRGSAY